MEDLNELEEKIRTLSDLASEICADADEISGDSENVALDGSEATVESVGDYLAETAELLQCAADSFYYAKKILEEREKARRENVDRN